ncbi:MAG: hypothetical protein R2716_11020 [Microthrixaceae bacterium]
MDERPRSLRAMPAEAKDSLELMIDLAYAAVYFNDPGMASEVGELEERMNDLVQDMRAVCIMAVRRPAEAEGMASEAGDLRHRGHCQRIGRHHAW